ncbi:MAG: T9SS type A sorting domain-containing protein [Lewinella sp.]
MRRFLAAVLFALPCLLAAQFAITPAYPGVTDNTGRNLPLAWLGGLNAPQYMRADLDGDGLMDLYLFDRSGDAQIALRGDGSGRYTPAPELLAGFPANLTNWVLLRDYDGDGLADLFAYSAEFDGFRVHRGFRTAAGLLSYAETPTYAGLRYPFNNGTIPIFVTSIDYPAVDDIDGDGDLDILTFSVGGGYVEYFKNYSVERGFGTDTLLYELESECWGGFFESGLTPALDLASEAGACYGKSLSDSTRVGSRHAGSTVLTLDADGNGLKDIMLGDISFQNLVLGWNKGDEETAWISDQDPTWPSGGVEAKIPYFPGAYHLDLDDDGHRDIIASPSQTLNAEDINVGWYYRNTGTDAAPAFAFQDSQFLVRDAIDLGTGGLPAGFDYDADGRTDLVIGNTESYGRDGGLDSRLRLYRNTAQVDGEASFELVDTDYLGLSRFRASTSAFAPAFGDLDGDGDLDAIIGQRSGQLIYFENVAGAGRPAAFAEPVFNYMDIDAGQLAKPEVADLDRDGLNDLVVGGFDGRIRFYRNRGTAGEPQFDPDEAADGNFLQLGGINTNKPGLSSGHPTPRVLSYDDRFLLISGNRSGTLEAYSFTDYTEPFTSLGDTVAGLDLGGYSAPGAADFDNDGNIELIVGNERGGVTFFRTDLAKEPTTGLFTARLPEVTFTVFPNPSTGAISLRELPAATTQRVRVINGQGQIVYSRELGRVERTELELSSLPSGLYILEVLTSTSRGVRTVQITR